MFAVRRLLSLAVFALALFWGPAAFAQCVFSGGNSFTCSGNANGSFLSGTAGDDVFYVLDGTTGTITIDGGGGNDTLDLANFSTPVTVNLSQGGAPQPVAAGLNLWVQGFDTPGATYILRGGSASDTLTGGMGDDTLVGGLGSDTLNGGAGTDTRADSDPADCAGDLIAGIEIDNCPAPPPIPTVSEWTMIGLGLALGFAAVLGLGRRRRAV